MGFLLMDNSKEGNSGIDDDKEATETEIWHDAHQCTYIVMDKKPIWEELSWGLQDRLKNNFGPLCCFLQRNKTK